MGARRYPKNCRRPLAVGGQGGGSRQRSSQGVGVVVFTVHGMPPVDAVRCRPTRGCRGWVMGVGSVTRDQRHPASPGPGIGQALGATAPLPPPLSQSPTAGPYRPPAGGVCPSRPRRSCSAQPSDIAQESDGTPSVEANLVHLPPPPAAKRQTIRYRGLVPSPPPPPWPPSHTQICSAIPMGKDKVWPFGPVPHTSAPSGRGQGRTAGTHASGA